MIAFIKGTLYDVANDHLIVENNGIGYNIFVPVSVINSLPVIGDEIILYTYFSVKEDAMQLFGFLSDDDLKLFKLLITVNGIGPKGALSILSAVDSDTLKIAIIKGEDKLISSAPGIGTKTAQKIIIELKDKISKLDVLSVPTSNITLNNDSLYNDALLALTSLGYSQKDSANTLKSMDISNDSDVSDIIKAALKLMSKH